VVRWRYLMRAGLAAMLVSVLGSATNVGADSLKSGGTILGSSATRSGAHARLDQKLNDRARNALGGTSRVIIIQVKPGSAAAEVTRLGGKLGRRLGFFNGQVAEVPNARLRNLADHPSVVRIIWDRPMAGEMNRVAVTVGARVIQDSLGYKGAGIGVAVIDSGVTSWHNDLTYNGTSSVVKSAGGQRVAAFVDFVSNHAAAYDDNGHGTHVSGIIAGNGYDTRGARAGIAPSAHLVSLKVLDRQGRGVISDVIAALDWAVTNKALHNIRVINLSVGAAVTESYKTDLLTLAAKRAVDAGIVVVTAAGNLGKNALGQAQYGGITAPGNAPWVLTVGASNHQGSVTRVDDKMGSYSSRGPSALDFHAKPDLVAPGTGVVSLADATSLMYVMKASYLLKGTLFSASKPYLSLTGTSMSSPVVAGSVALMLEANPTLTPNLVKAILQYTAQEYAGYDALTQGAGFLNTKGAVELARFFRTAKAGDRYPTAKVWSKKLLWGNQRLSKGIIKPNAPAWELGVVWGAVMDADGDNVVWGTQCGDVCASMFWGASDSEDKVVWGTAAPGNDIWGTYFRADEGDNIVWGTMSEGDNVVWGTMSEGDNVVWGTDCKGADCTGVVWGTYCRSADEGDNIVWGTMSEGDNVVWGTSGEVDALVWGSAISDEEDNLTWGNSGEDAPMFDDPDSLPATFDASVWEDLFGPDTLDPLSPVVEAAPAVAETTEPVAEEPLPVAEEPVPVAEEPLPVAEEPVPVVEELLPAVEPGVVESIVLTPLVGVIGGI
jgi:serine protease AprX